MTMKAHESALLNASYRSAVYGLFGKALRRPRQYGEPWVRGELLKGLAELADRIPGGHAPTSADIAPLRIRQQEFTRLFESHGQMVAPPYETEYTKDWPQQSLLQSATLADVSGFYKAFGLEIGTHCAERCDHIRLELEFLHFLGLKEAIALDRGETEHWEIVRDAQKKFLEDHAGRWPHRLAERLRQKEALPFYLKLAELLALWIEEDMAALGCVTYQPSMPGDQIPEGTP